MKTVSSSRGLTSVWVCLLGGLKSPTKFFLCLRVFNWSLSVDQPQPDNVPVCDSSQALYAGGCRCFVSIYAHTRSHTGHTNAHSVEQLPWLHLQVCHTEMRGTETSLFCLTFEFNHFDLCVMFGLNHIDLSFYLVLASLKIKYLFLGCLWEWAEDF